MKTKITFYLPSSDKYVDVIGNDFEDCYIRLWLAYTKNMPYQRMSIPIQIADFYQSGIFQTNYVEDKEFTRIKEIIGIFESRNKEQKELTQEADEVLKEFQCGIPAMNLLDSESKVEIEPAQSKNNIS